MNYKVIWSSCIVLGLLAGACSSDDSNSEPEPSPVGYTTENVSAAPQWAVDWSWSDDTPQWTEPDASQYATWSIAVVTLQKELAATAAEGDLMAAFIGDELRAVARPAINAKTGQMEEKPMFVLEIFSDQTSDDDALVTLRYYSSALRNTFTAYTDLRYVAEGTVGITEDYVPYFTVSSSKFPAVTALFVGATSAQGSSFTPDAGDLLAVFSGDECRGVQTLTSDQQGWTDGTSATAAWDFLVPLRTEGEPLTLRYYSARSQTVYTFPVEQTAEGSVKLQF